MTFLRNLIYFTHFLKCPWIKQAKTCSKFSRLSWFLCHKLGMRAGQWDREIGAQRYVLWYLQPRAVWDSIMGQLLLPPKSRCGVHQVSPLCGFTGPLGFPSHDICHSPRIPAGPHPSHQTPCLLHRLLSAGKSSALLGLMMGSELSARALLVLCTPQTFSL